MTGMAYGMVLSTRAKDANAALQGALGSFLPLILLSGALVVTASNSWMMCCAGVIWPVEAMPTWLQIIAKAATRPCLVRAHVSAGHAAHVGRLLVAIGAAARLGLPQQLRVAWVCCSPHVAST